MTRFVRAYRLMNLVMDGQVAKYICKNLCMFMIMHMQIAKRVQSAAGSGKGRFGRVVQEQEEKTREFLREGCYCE